MSQNTAETCIDDYDYSVEADAYIDFSEADVVEDLKLVKQNSLVFVTLTDVISLLQDKCKEITEILNANDDEALVILNHYKWRKDLLESDWFENEERLRNKIGIEPQEIAAVEDTPEYLCCMCFETKPKEEFDSLKCNHLACKDCWTEYIQYNVIRPENIFFWKCPLDGCNMVIPDTFNKKYIDTEKLPQYHKKMARAYTDTSKSLRWCPAVNCQYGADLSSFRARAVECRCGWVYCFKCGQEDHSPCPCDVASEWNKNGANKDMLLCRMWVIANTKDCPKCKKPIEKNQGCNHMTCRNLGCMYEFCWICFQKWGSAHDSYLCQQYEKEGKKVTIEKNEEETKELERICAYKTQYKKYDESLETTGEVFKLIQSDEKYFEYFGISHYEMEFFQTACYTLRSMKRLVKWGFVYLFYLSDGVERDIIKSLHEKLEKHTIILQGYITGRYQEAKFSKRYYSDSKEKIRTAEFKCKQLSAAIFEKVEEFENKKIIENFSMNKDQIE